ncbi:hypothetical protein AB5I41_25980 [Sphingomonas sp. MMS24-JH45]
MTADQYPWLASGSAVAAALVPGWALDGGDAKMRSRASTIAPPPRRCGRRCARISGGAGAPESILLTGEDQPWTGRTLARWRQGGGSTR